MLPKDNFYIGFLTNVDSSILNLKLKHGYRIDSIKINKYQTYIEDYKKDEIFYELYKSYFGKVISSDVPIVNQNEGKIYFITNSSDKHRINQMYPYELLKLLRLFKEGNISIPVAFESERRREKEVKSSFSATSSMLHVQPFPKYTLTDSDLKKLDNFLKTFKIPFKKSYLQLAFDNLELSYFTHNRKLSFLTSLIGFEALFNRGPTELAQTVSRHTAVLIGKNKRDSEKIFKDMRKFYTKRSHIVHAIESKKHKKIEDHDITELRNYLRECIKEIYLLNYEKQQLYDLLNSRGFI